MNLSQQMVEIEVELDSETVQELEEWAQREGITVDELVTRFLEEKLNGLAAGRSRS